MRILLALLALSVVGPLPPIAPKELPKEPPKQPAPKFEQLPPHTKSSALSSPVFFKTTALTVEIVEFPPGEVVRFRGAAFNSPSCYTFRRTGDAPEVTVDAKGYAKLTVLGVVEARCSGWFHPDGGETRLSYTLRLDKKNGNTWDNAAYLLKTNVVVKKHRKVVINDTWKLRNFLDTKIWVGGVGGCGYTTSGSPDSPAGATKIGDRFALKVEAAAVGTDCSYDLIPNNASNTAGALPEAVMPLSITWRTEQHGNRCCLGQDPNNDCSGLPGEVNPMPRTLFGPGITDGTHHNYWIFSNKAEFVHPPSGVTVFKNISGGWRTKMLEQFARLSCKPRNGTHRIDIAVVLDELALAVPDGTPLPWD